MVPTKGPPSFLPLLLSVAAAALGAWLLLGFSLHVDLILDGPFGPLQLDAAGGIPGAFLVLVGLVGLAAAASLPREHLDGVGRGLVSLFLAGLVLVPLAGDVFTFLLAWELMSASPGIILVLSERAQTRRAGLVYLVYAHASAVAILAGLLLWAGGTDGSFEALASTKPPTLALLLLLLGALIKAGIMPFHYWLPEAHPAAPAPVSALMSGVMVALPAYLVLRLFPAGALPNPAAIIVLLLGSLSAALAALHAFQARDLKRILALTTVAHMGAVFALLGLDQLLRGPATGPLHAALASTVTAYLVTHGLAKGALFLAAGEIHHATGELDLERLGGLWRTLGPLALVAGLAGAALAGLPPFGAFPSELALFTTTFAGLARLDPLGGVILLGALFLLGIGAGAGLAVIAKVLLGAFHGPARDAQAPVPRARPALVPATMLLATSLLLGLAPGVLWSGLPAPARDAWTLPTPAGEVVLWPLLAIGAAVLLGLALVVRATTSPPRPAEPWATGGPAPVPRQTYTPQALVMPYRILFAEMLRPASDLRLQDAPVAPFAPSKGQFEDPSPRYIEPWIHRPLLRFLLPKIDRLRLLHRGSVQLYLIIALLVLVLLLFLLPVIP